MESSKSSGLSRESALGKLVSVRSAPGSSFLVTNVTYDVLERSYVAHLRRVPPDRRPDPRPVPLSHLSESNAIINDPKSVGPALLVARALEGRPIATGGVFQSRTE